MTQANYGTFNFNKCAVSAWIKQDTAVQPSGGIYNFGDAYANRALVLRIKNAGVSVYTVDSSGTLDGDLQTYAVYTDTSVWTHVLVHLDVFNATASERMKMWVDGSRIVAPNFYIETYPAAVSRADPIDGMVIGGTLGYGFDGKVYQPVAFSDYLPDISEVYNAGAPVDVTGITGVRSLLDPDTSVTADYVLATDWTNINTVTLSAEVPT